MKKDKNSSSEKGSNGSNIVSRYIRRKDVCFAAVVLLAAIVVGIVYRGMNGTGASQVRVEVDGSIYGVYSLLEEQSIRIPFTDEEGFNELVIFEGKAQVTEADCQDKLCVKQRSVSRTGESIVCLPHRLVITVEKAGEADYDSISR